MKKELKQKIFNKKILYSILSFVISSLIILIIFLFNKMNGKDYLVIRSDFFDSIGFYKDAIRSIFNHESLFFNFSSGLGLNNIMAVSGLFTPFNLLYLILNQVDFDLVTAIIIILKIGFASLSFQIFSMHTLKNDKISSVIISVFYSLNAFTIEYGTVQNGWLEALIILPILCSSIIESIENNKRVNMIILYSYLFISNFYMGYVIGGFSLLFVILYFIFKFKTKTEKKYKEIFKQFFNWALGVLIAIMLSAFIWVPTLFFLASNRVPDSTEIVSINSSLLQILNSLFWGMDYGIEGTYSYIYCGIPVLILFPLFFCNNNIENKEKWFLGILSFVIALSMVSDRLNKVWHVFDQPDDFWYRYSFLLCFCFCYMASVEISHFDNVKWKELLFAILGLSFFYQLMLHTSSLWDLEDAFLNTNYGFIVNLFLMIIWSIVIFWLNSKSKSRVICIFFAFSVLIFELVSNSKREMKYLINAKEYHIWDESVNSVIKDIQNNDNSFYRTIIASNNIGYNSDTYYGLKGIGDFGNQEKYSVRTFLSNVGFATSPRITCENGYNPVANMILGVKYEIYAPKFYVRASNIDDSVSDEVLDDQNINDLSKNLNSDLKVDSESKDKEIINIDEGLNKNNSSYYSYYIENPYSLNIGYLVSGEIILFNFPGRNVFENMNELISCMSGKEDKCYITVPMDNVSFYSDNMEMIEMDTGEFVFSRNTDDSTMEISIPKEQYDKAYIQFEKEETGLYGIDYFVLDGQNNPNASVNRLALSSAIQMTTSEDERKFITTIGSYSSYSPEYFSCDKVNASYLDEESLIKQFNELKKNQLQVTQYSNGHIKGTVHSDGDKNILFTTIPYDPGWKAYINGIETEPIRVIDGAFMAIILPGEGDYNVSFDFECPGLKIGIIVSVCGILALLSVIFEKRLKKNK